MEYIINTLTYFSLYCKNDDNNININNNNNNNLDDKNKVINLSSLNITDNTNNLKVKKKSLLLKKSEGYKNTYNSSYLIN